MTKQKRVIQIFAHASLCCLIVASTESTHAMNLAQLGKAAHIGLTLVRKMGKATAILGATYLLVRQILNHRYPRYDATVYPILFPATTSADPVLQPTINTLRVITDGKVTVKASDSIKVTHKYGATWGSNLEQIRFDEPSFDQEHKTLTVLGLLEECHTGKFQRFIQWLFRIQPQRTLHTIIEVPGTTNVEITTGSSDRYAHTKKNFTAVHIDSIRSQIKALANAGNILIKNSGTTNKLIEVRTPDQVFVTDFNGNLSVYNAQKFQIKRNPKNDHGQIRYNDILQPFLLAYPPTSEQSLRWVKRPTQDLTPDELIHIWTPEQLQKLEQNWIPEQIQLWTVKQLQIWTPEQLKHWTPERLQWWASHWEATQLQYWRPEQLQQWTAEQIQPLLPEQLQHITPDQLLQFWPQEQLQLLTQRWPAEQLQNWIYEQLQRWIPEQLQLMGPDQLQLRNLKQLLHLNQHKDWKTDQLQHWTPEQLQRIIPEQLRDLPNEELEQWIPHQLKLQIKGWEEDQLQRWVPEALQHWKELLLRREQIKKQSQ